MWVTTPGCAPDNSTYGIAVTFPIPVRWSLPAISTEKAMRCPGPSLGLMQYGQETKVPI